PPCARAFPYTTLFRSRHEGQQGKETYGFQRGVGAYPTVGDPVLLPTQVQLRAIVESGENRRVKNGVSPLAANAEVCIDPDRLFRSEEHTSELQSRENL